MRRKHLTDAEYQQLVADNGRRLVDYVRRLDERIQQARIPLG